MLGKSVTKLFYAPVVLQRGVKACRVLLSTLSTQTDPKEETPNDKWPQKVKELPFSVPLKSHHLCSSGWRWALRVVKSTSWVIGALKLPCWVWNITFDTLGWHEKQSFGTTFTPKQTGSSAGHRRRLISVNNKSAVICHDRLYLTWKVFLHSAGSRSRNKDGSKFHMLLVIMLFSAHKLMPQIRPGICFGEPSCQSTGVSRFISKPAAKRKSLQGFWHHWRWISLQISRRYSSPKNSYCLYKSPRGFCEIWRMGFFKFLTYA